MCSLASIGEVCPTEALKTLIAAIEKELEGIAENGSVRVEQIQDNVEIELMRAGFYRQGPPLYSLPRGARQRPRFINEIEQTIGLEGMHRLLKDVQRDYPHLCKSFGKLVSKYHAFHKPSMTAEEGLHALTRAAVECITAEEPTGSL